MTFLRCVCARGLRRCLLLLPLAGLLPGPVAAQDTTVSATMLRVLAEAADVHRTGRPVFLVADYRFPHNVVGQLPSLAEAQKMRADSGASFGVFGPYVTPADAVSDSASRVLAVRVLLQTPRGRQTWNVDLRRVDALFWSPSAMDKFVIPYYGRTYGPEYARRLQERIGRLGRIFCHAHSWLCVPAPLGGLLPVMEPGDPYP